MPFRTLSCLPIFVKIGSGVLVWRGVEFWPFPLTCFVAFKTLRFLTGSSLIAVCEVKHAETAAFHLEAIVHNNIAYSMCVNLFSLNAWFTDACICGCYTQFNFSELCPYLVQDEKNEQLHAQLWQTLVRLVNFLNIANFLPYFR